MSAFLTNRVGDCFLTIGMFAIVWSLGNEQIFKFLLCLISKDNQCTNISFIHNSGYNNSRSIIFTQGTYKTYRCINYSQRRQYSSLGPYLAGLIEGDGHIAVQDVNTQKVVYRPKIIIAFKGRVLTLTYTIERLTIKLREHLKA